MKEFTAHTTAELEAPARHIAGLLQKYPVAFFTGEMGSGKTTLIKAVCASLGSADSVSSPTFSIVNEYLYTGGSIYHFDLYRLKDASELWDTGFGEYIDSGSVCLIEWPALSVQWLKGAEVVQVTLHKEQEKRMIHIEITRI